MKLQKETLEKIESILGKQYDTEESLMHLGRWFEEKLAKNLHKPLVSNRRELLIRFLTDINCKELDKCNWIPNIPEVVDNYLKSN